MLEEFIEANKVDAEIINCRQEVQTAKDVMQVLQLPLDEIAKTVLFITADNEPVLIILLGNSRVSEKKACGLLGTKSIRVADADEVEEITGYLVGGVPPISVYGVKTIMDKKVEEKEKIVAGGGDKMHLIKISPQAIKDNVEELIVEDVAE